MTLNQEVESLREIIAINNSNQNLICRMERIIDLQEKKIEQMGAEKMGRNWWFTRHHPEMAKEYVEVCYENLDRKSAKAEDAFIHDEVTDLSQMACTENDFKAWVK
jgi:hypothetical protein